MNPFLILVSVSCIICLFRGSSAKHEVGSSSLDQRLFSLQIAKCIQMSMVKASSYYTSHSYEKKVVENTCLKLNEEIQYCLISYGVDNCGAGEGSPCSRDEASMADLLYGLQDAIGYICTDANARTLLFRHFDDCFFTKSTGYTYLKCTASFFGRLFFQKLGSMCQSFEDFKSCVVNKVPDTCKNANAAKVLKELQEKVFTRFVDGICDYYSNNENGSPPAEKSIFDILMDI